MKLHYDTVSPLLISCLKKLSESDIFDDDCFRGYAWELISIDLKTAAEEFFNNEQITLGINNDE